MRTAFMLLLATVIVCGYNSCRSRSLKKQLQASNSLIDTTFLIMEKTEAEWLAELGAEKYSVLRQCSTEPPFTGKYVDHHEKGRYRCAGCNTILFSSETKYDSGSGWPSFFDAIDKTKIVEAVDTTFGMVRVEIKCARCGGHLGHVFTDGPDPTGLRYCVNSAALEFDAEK